MRKIEPYNGSPNDSWEYKYDYSEGYLDKKFTKPVNDYQGAVIEPGISLSDGSFDTYLTFSGSTLKYRGVLTNDWRKFYIKGTLGRGVKYIIVNLVATALASPQLNGAVADVRFKAGQNHKVEYQNEKGQTIFCKYVPDGGLIPVDRDFNFDYWKDVSTKVTGSSPKLPPTIGFDLKNIKVHRDYVFRQFKDVLTEAEASERPETYKRIVFNPTSDAIYRSGVSPAKPTIFWVNPDKYIDLEPFAPTFGTAYNNTYKPATNKLKFLFWSKTVGNKASTTERPLRGFFNEEETITALIKPYVVDKGVASSEADTTELYRNVAFESTDLGDFGTPDKTVHTFQVLDKTTWQQAIAAGLKAPNVANIKQGYSRAPENWKPTWPPADQSKAVSSSRFIAQYVQKPAVQTTDPRDPAYTTFTFKPNADDSIAYLDLDNHAATVKYWILKSAQWKDVRADKNFKIPEIHPGPGYVIPYTNEGWNEPILSNTEEVGTGPFERIAQAKKKSAVMLIDPKDENYVKFTFQPDDHARVNSGKRPVNFWVFKGTTWENATTRPADTTLDYLEIPEKSADVGYKLVSTNQGWDKALPEAQTKVEDVPEQNRVFTATTEKKTLVIADTNPGDPDYVTVKFLIPEAQGSLSITSSGVKTKDYYINRIATWDEVIKYKENNKAVFVIPTVSLNTGYYLVGYYLKPAPEANTEQATLAKIWQTEVPYNKTTPVYNFTFQANVLTYQSVIEDNNGDGAERPAGYAKLIYEVDANKGKFLSGDTTTYYYNPDKTDLTVADIPNKPHVEPAIGYKDPQFNPNAGKLSEVPTKELPVAGDPRKKEKVSYITVDFTEESDSADPENPPPEYIAVIFNPGSNGTFTSAKTKTLKYFNPNVYKKVRDLINKNQLPQITAAQGYYFTGWAPGADVDLKNGTTLTATYVENVLAANPDGSRPKNVPDVFKKITILKTDEPGVEKPTTETSAPKYFYVNPYAEVTLPLATTDYPDGNYVPDGGPDKIGMQYVFKEWKQSEPTVTPERTWQGRPVGTFTEDTTIVATYHEYPAIIPDPKIPRPSHYVTVIYDLDNKGSSKSFEGNQKIFYVRENVGKTLNDLKVNNEPISLDANSVIAFIPYKFLGWKLDGGANPALPDTLVVQANITIVAKYDPEENIPSVGPEPQVGYIRVAFDPQGGHFDNGLTKPLSYDVREGTTLGAIFPHDPTKSEYKFLYWTAVEDSSAVNRPEYKVNDAKIGPDTVFPASVKLYAVWKNKPVVTQDKPVVPPHDTFDKEYATVKFVANQGYYGDVNKQAQLVYYVLKGHPFGEEFPALPKRDYFDFRYYTETDPGDTNEGPRSYFSGATKVWEDMTFYALWDRKTVNLTINPNYEGGKTLTVKAPMHVAVGENLPEKLARPGYRFVGYTKTAEENSDKINRSSVFDADTEIFAQWNKIVLTAAEAEAEHLTENPTKLALYSKVTFKSGDHGRFRGAAPLDKEQTYYVLNDATWQEARDNGLEIPTLAGVDIGWKLVPQNDGWDAPLPQISEVLSDNRTFTKQYAEEGNIVPGDQPKPDGYITVEFRLHDLGYLDPAKPLKYHVNPNKAVKLGDLGVNLGKTGVRAAQNYEFLGWKKNGTGNYVDGTLVLNGSDTIYIDAMYTPADVIPIAEKTAPLSPSRPGDASAFYSRIIFEVEGGKFAAGENDFLAFDVLNGKSLGQYFPVPPTKDKSRFAGWSTEAGNPEKIDKSLSAKTPSPFNPDHTVAKTYYAIWETKPEIVKGRETADADKEYALVTFVAENGGSLRGITEYSVLKDAEKTWQQVWEFNQALQEESERIVATPAHGYIKKPDWDTKLKDTIPNGGGVYKIGFKELGDIEQGDTAQKTYPDLYVLVTFKPGAHGTLSGTTVYSVLKNSKIFLGRTEIQKPEVRIPDQDKNAWDFDKWDKPDSYEIKDQNVEVTALYKSKDIEITFIKDNGEADETIAGKVSQPLPRFPENPTREGYRFLGWNLSGNGKGREITSGSFFDTTTNVYAVWKKIVLETTPLPEDADNYVKVSFNSGAFGKFTAGGNYGEEKVFYVLKETNWTEAQAAGLKIPHAVEVKPGHSPKQGGEAWSPALPEASAPVTAGAYTLQYTDYVGPIVEDGPRPEGYVEVAVDLDGKGDHSQFAGNRKVWYVDPTADQALSNLQITVGGQKVAFDWNKAAVTNKSSEIKFTFWALSTALSTEVNTSEKITEDMLIIAQYTPSNVVPGDKDGDIPSGRVRVGFELKPEGFEAQNGGEPHFGSDQSTKAKYFFVKKNEALGAYAPTKPPVWPGYKFLGWHEAGDAAGKYTEFTATAPTFDANKTYTAQWSVKPVVVPAPDTTVAGDPDYVLVTFEANEGHFGAAATATTAAYYVLKGKSLNQSALDTVAGVNRENYSFGGWSLNGSDTRAEEVNAETKFYANTVYKAIWTRDQFEVSFKLNASDSDETVYATASINKGEPLKTVAAPQVNPIREGYVFRGWFTEPENGKPLSEVDTPVTKNETLYAHWLKAVIENPTGDTPSGFVRITFNLKGGEIGGSTADKVFDIYSGRALGDQFPQEPVKENMSFLYWSADEQATPEAADAGLNAFTTFSETKTYYAVYDKTGLTVTFDANGGSVTPASVKVNKNETLGGNLPTPTREKYTFIGWTDEREGGQSVAADTPIQKSLTIYAQWKQTVLEKEPTSPADQEKYVTLTFNSGANGKFTSGHDGYSEEKKFYVYDGTTWADAKAAGLQVPTVVEIQTGYSLKRENDGWNKALPTDKLLKSKESDYVYTAQYEQAENVIPVEPGTEKPEGYVTVTFDLDGKAKHEQFGEVNSKSWYVNPKAGITIGDLKVGADPLNLAATAVHNLTTEYVFQRWALKSDLSEITAATTITGDMTVIATYTPDDVVPGKKEPDEVPFGRVRVGFLLNKASISEPEGAPAFGDGSREDKYFYVTNGKSLGSHFPGNPVWAGYRFDGWAEAGDGKAVDPQPDGEMKFTAQKLYYAKWTKKLAVVPSTDPDAPVNDKDYVLVTFKANEGQFGTVTPAVTELKFYVLKGKTLDDQTMAAIGEVNRKDWTFSYWTKDQDLTTSPLNAGLTKEYKFFEATTFNAIWKKNTVTVTFHNNYEGANPEVYATVQVTIDEPVGSYVPSENPERAYYRFDGWYMEADGTTKLDNAYVVTKVTDIYAKWTENKAVIDKGTDDQTPPDKGYVKVVFDSGDQGKITTGAHDKKVYWIRDNLKWSDLPSQGFKAPAVTDLDADHYRNFGWSEDVPTGDASVEAKTFVMQYKKIVLDKGHDVDSTAEGYVKVIFNSGDYGKFNAGYDTNNEPRTYLVLTETTWEKAKVAGLVVPTVVVNDAAVHKLKGTNNLDCWDKTLPADGDKVETATYIAQYEGQDIIITFDYNFTGKPHDFTRPAKKGEKIQDFPFSTDVRPGWRFVEWNTEKNGKGTKVDADTKSFTKDTTVYAQWKEIVITNPQGDNPADGYVRITFNPEGGQFGNSKDNKVFDILRGEALGQNFPNEPVKTDHGFKWWSESNAQGAANANLTPETTFNETKTYYAIYDRNRVTVTFHYNYPDDAGQRSPEDFNRGADANQKLTNFPVNPSNLPTYSFDGWNLKPDGTDKAFTSDSIVPDNIDVYGIWKKTVVPKDNATSGNPDENKYVTVTFLSGADGKFAGEVTEKVYYIYKGTSWEKAEEAGLVVPAVEHTTITVGKRVAAAPGNWNPVLPDKTSEVQEAAYTAQYEELQPIIPAEGDRPNGYITVTFKLDGKGSLPSIPDGELSKYVDPKKVKTLGEIVPDMADVKNLYNDYRFTGWKIGDQVVTAATEISGDKDLVVIAQYTPDDVVPGTKDGDPGEDSFKVGFILKEESFQAENGGVPSFAEDGSTADKYYFVRSGKPLGAYAPKAPVWPGYQFLGWKETTDGMVTISADEPLIRSDKTYTAQWKAKDQVVVGDPTKPGEGQPVVPGEQPGQTKPDSDYVRVSFDANTGAFGTEDNAPTVKLFWVLKGKSLGDKFDEVGEPQKANYTFGGWALEADNTTPNDVRKTTVFETSTSYYAIWSKTQIAVKFYMNESDADSRVYATVMVDQGSELKSVKLPEVNPAREGYDFRGWFTDRAGTNKLAASTAKVETETAVYAHWLQRVIPVTDPQTQETPEGYVRIVFDPNGGKFGNDTGAKVFDVRNGAALGELFPNQPTMENFGFKFWSETTSDDAVEAKVDGKPLSATTKFTVGKTYHAIWDKNRVTVTFNYNYPSDVGMASPESFNRTTVKDTALGTAFPANPSDLPGYSFEGWNTVQNAKVANFTKDTVVSEYKTTVYAIWKKTVETEEPKVPGEQGGEQPDPNYVAVTFNSGDQGWFTAGNAEVNETKTYYVYKTATWAKAKKDGLSVPAIPAANIKIGQIRKPAPGDWSPVLPEDAAVVTAETYTAQYEKNSKNLIPDDGTTEKPYGYITVTFDLDGKGTLSGFEASPGDRKSWFVNPAAETAVTLGDMVGNMSEVKGIDSYNFLGWKAGAKSAEAASKVKELLADPSQTELLVVATYDPDHVQVPSDPTKPAPAGRVKITFNVNEGHFADGTTTDKTFHVLRGKTLGAYMPAQPIREGYTFNGWFSEPKGGNKETIDGTTALSTDKTYYAQWTAKPDVVPGDPTTPGEGQPVVPGEQPGTEKPDTDYVRVSFSPNGGTFGESADSKIFWVLKGKSLGRNFTDMGKPTLANKDFLGWLKSTTAETVNDIDETTVFYANAEFYAKWGFTPIKVSFYLNYGTETKPYYEVNVDKGSTFLVDKLPIDPVRKGWDFRGWFRDEQGETAFDTTKGETITTDTKVYAKWFEEVRTVTDPDKEKTPEGYVRVTFNYNGGTKTTRDGSPNDVYDVLIGAALGENFPLDPTKSNMTFQYWTEAVEPASGTNPEKAEIDATYKFRQSDNGKVYYAYYDNHMLTITYDANGGTVSEASTSVQENSTIDSLPKPTRKDYSFDGWNTKKDGSGEPFTTATKVTESRTIYAQWKKTVEPKDEQTPQNPDPEKYVSLTFDSGEHGKFTAAHTGNNEEKIFYVYKGTTWKQALESGLIVPVPTAFDTGWKQKSGADAWSQEALPGETVLLEENKRFTAQYEQKGAVLTEEPKLPGGETDPDYAKISFVADGHSKLTGDHLTYWVVKGTTWKQAREDRTNPVKFPTATADEGYVMKKAPEDWNPALPTADADDTRIENDQIFTTQTEMKQKVVAGDPTAEDKGQPKKHDPATGTLINDNDYVLITFKAGEGTTINGQKEDILFWVLKISTWGEAKAADPALKIPEPKADDGHTLTELNNGWDHSLPQDNVVIGTLDDANRTYTASSAGKKVVTLIDPKDPQAYSTLTFKPDEGTTLNGAEKSIVYYILKGTTWKSAYEAGLEIPTVERKVGYTLADPVWDKPVPAKTDAAATAVEMTLPEVITAQSKQKDAVVPDEQPKVDDGTGTQVPDTDYVAITFNPTKKGQLELGGTALDVGATKTYYVVKTATWTDLAGNDRFAEPTVLPITGEHLADADHPWNHDVPKTGPVYAFTFVAQYEADLPVIPATPDIQRPKNYVTVTYTNGKDGAQNGTINQGEITKYYVNPTAGVLLKNVTKPAVTPHVGYDFEAWVPREQDVTLDSEVTKDVTVDATWTRLPDIIPVGEGQGERETRPEGYVKVTFDLNGKGTLAAIGAAGKKSFWVNPQADPKASYATVLPTLDEVKGKDKNNFLRWEINGVALDKDAEIAGPNDVYVIASYDTNDVLIPSNPDAPVEDGRVKVVFKPQGGQFADGTTEPKAFHVWAGKPLGAYYGMVENPTRVGYNFKGWGLTSDATSKVSVDDKTEFGKAATYYAIWAEKSDIETTQPMKNGQPDPDYAQVTFVAYKGGAVEGTKTYWVRKDLNKTVQDILNFAQFGTPHAQLRAVPDDDHIFDKWAPTGITEMVVTGNLDVTALFDLKPKAAAPTIEKIRTKDMINYVVTVINVKDGDQIELVDEQGNRVGDPVPVKNGQASFTLPTTYKNEQVVLVRASYANPATAPKRASDPASYSLDKQAPVAPKITAKEEDDFILLTPQPDTDDAVRIVISIPQPNGAPAKTIELVKEGESWKVKDGATLEKDAATGLLKLPLPDGQKVPAPSVGKISGKSYDITGNFAEREADTAALPVTVTFDGNAPDAKVSADTVTVNKGDRIGDKLPMATRPGYRFEGWFLHDDAGKPTTKVTADTEVTAPMTAYAEWRKIVLTEKPSDEEAEHYVEVIFYSDEEAAKPAAEQDKTREIGPFSDDSREQHFWVLVGTKWKDMPAAGLTVPVTDDSKLKPGYTRKTGAAAWSPELPTDDTALVKKTEPYTFVAQYQKFDKSWIPADKGTERPRGYILVTFDLNGRGHHPDIPEGTYDEGIRSFYVDPTAGVLFNDLVRMDKSLVRDKTAEYIFKDWRNVDSGVEITETSVISGEHDIKVIASYTPNPVTVVIPNKAPDNRDLYPMARVLFDPQGGSFRDGGEENRLYYVRDGEEIGGYYPEPDTMKRPYYEPKYWSDEPQGEQATEITAKTTLYDKDYKKLYMVWERKPHTKPFDPKKPKDVPEDYILITFHATGGTLDKHDKGNPETYRFYLLKDDPLLESDMPFASRFNYKFLHWALTYGGENCRPANKKYDKNTDFYAVWMYIHPFTPIPVLPGEPEEPCETTCPTCEPGKPCEPCKPGVPKTGEHRPTEAAAAAMATLSLLLLAAYLRRRSHKDAES